MVRTEAVQEKSETDSMKSIRFKILGSVLAVLITSVGVIGYFSIHYSKAALQSEIERNTIQLSEGYAADLGFKIRFYSRLMQTVALSLFNAVSIETVLIDQKRSYPEFHQLFYTNLTGRVVEYHPRNKEYFAFPFYKMPFWKQVKQHWERLSGQWENLVAKYGEAAPTHIVTESIVVSEVTQVFGAPAIVISAPVPVYYGGVFMPPDIQGVVSVVIPLKTLFENTSSIKIGVTGAAVVIDGSGRVLSHPDASAVLRKNLSDLAADASLETIEAAMTERNTGIGSYRHEHKEYFLAFAPVPGVSWSLGVFGPLSEFISGVKQLTVVNLFILCISVAVATVVIIMIIGTIVKPIRHLTEVIGYIRHGNLDVKAHVSSRDEIGQLAATLNTMTWQLEESINEREVLQNRNIAIHRQAEEELRQYRDQLEERVKEQTEELETANSDLRQEIIERKRAEEEAQEARKAADDANRAKSEFLANMSHELRTPLNAILGFSQIMAGRPHSDEDKEHLDIILRNGDHLLNLINQVLDLSKIEAGRITLNVKEFDLCCLLDEIFDMFRVSAQKKRLDMQFECDDQIPQSVYGDEIKLRQVLINLLNNAIKFTDEGKVTLKVSEKPLDRKDSVKNRVSRTLLFEITDTGIGIAPEETDKIFEPFGQADAGRQFKEGTGLGLPISRKFARLMGGDIQIKSEVGKGTAITFTIRADVSEDLQNTCRGNDLDDADSQASAAHHDQQAAADVLASGILETLPADLISELRDAVVIVDMDAAQAVIERIRSDNGPLADTLSMLAKDFRYDIIHEALKESKKNFS